MSEKEVDDSLEKIAKDRQSKCDHGLTFDKEAAIELLNIAQELQNERYQNLSEEQMQIQAMTDFVMGNPAHAEVRARWPRLNGLCPKGCGYNGIAYASADHYIYGDW